MQIQTTRFGAVSIEESDLITLPEGLLGFNDLRKFVILEDPDDLVFAWLQSCEKPGVAFPVLEPELFSSDYRVRLAKADRETLKLTADGTFRLFTIVNIPNDVTLMTANLKAPIAMNVATRIAKQVVTQENDHSIKFPIFIELQQRLLTSGLPTAAGAKKLVPQTSVSVKLQRPVSPDQQV